MLQQESIEQYQKHMSDKSITPLSQDMHILAHSLDLNYTQHRSKGNLGPQRDAET